MKSLGRWTRWQWVMPRWDGHGARGPRKAGGHHCFSRVQRYKGARPALPSLKFLDFGPRAFYPHLLMPMPLTFIRAVLKGPDFFFVLRTALKDRPKGPPTANRQLPPTANRRQPPPTANHQPPAATNRQLPTTANRHQPPITNHQPPPTTTNRHQPPVANCQPPTTANRQPPTATNHG